VFPIQPAAGSTPVGTLQPNTSINTCSGLEFVPLVIPGAAGHIVTPTAVNASANGANLFVSAIDATSKTGYLFAYSVGTVDCGNKVPNPVLTPLPGPPFASGVHPSAIASDPSGTYVYVTDFAAAKIL